VDSERLPSDLPQHLVDAAFFAGNGEAAWPPSVAAEVARWLGDHSYGVLGTELWIIKADGKICALPMGETGKFEVHGNLVSRHKGEPWTSFIRRAAKETSAYVSSFNALEIKEQGDVRFNITWTTEQEFDRLQSR
jgi:hypothetical protein